MGMALGWSPTDEGRDASLNTPVGRHPDRTLARSPRPKAVAFFCRGKLHDGAETVGEFGEKSSKWIKGWSLEIFYCGMKPLF